MVEFVSYDGRYPCLCSRTLIIKVDGKTYSFRDAMISSGYICGGPETGWEMWSEEGDWDVNLKEHPELEQYKEEIIRVVNDNVEHGCCGGCI